MTLTIAGVLFMFIVIGFVLGWVLRWKYFLWKIGNIDTHTLGQGTAPLNNLSEE